MYHIEHQMVHIPLWLYSSFKDIYNNTSYAQIQVQTNKLCYQQVGEENKSHSIFCRDKASDKAFLRQNPDFCRNRVSNKLCHDKTRFCRDRSSDKAFLQQNLDFVAKELVTNSVVIKPDFFTTELATNSITTKPYFVTT